MSVPAMTMIREATEELPRHSEASAVLLKDNRILLAWSRFEGRGDNATADIRTIESDPMASDNDIASIATATGTGLEFGEERVVVSNDAGLNVMSPALQRLADGSLGMAYSRRESTTEASRLFIKSFDEGVSWSAPVQMPQEDSYQTGCHDRLAVLSSGRIVAPLHCTADWHAHHLHVRTSWSDDHGETWKLSAPVALPKVESSGESGCIEPDVVERADGSLLMAIRTAMGTIFRAESHDGGETWENLRSMEVVAPVAPSLLRRIPGSDDLLLIWNWHYNWQEKLAGVRRPLATAISTDNGESWPVTSRKVLENDESSTFAYPSCLFVHDHAFVTWFVTPGEKPAGYRSLKGALIPIRWFYE